MFKIGEFSHIGRVSTRLLRYYDKLGLLPPGSVDPQTVTCPRSLYQSLS